MERVRRFHLSAEANSAGAKPARAIQAEAPLAEAPLAEEEEAPLAEEEEAAKHAVAMSLPRFPPRNLKRRGPLPLAEDRQSSHSTMKQYCAEQHVQISNHEAVL